MKVTLNLNPDVEQGLLAQAHERGISLDALLQDIIRKQGRGAVVSPTTNGDVPELPIRHLGAVSSLHWRDIYDDVG